MSDPDLGRATQELVAELQALRAENVSLRRAEAVLRAVVEGIDEPVYAKDGEGRYVLANSALARLLDRTTAEVLGRHDTELFSPETARQIGEADRSVLAGERTRTVETLTTVAGAVKTYLSTKSPYRDEKGRVIGVVGISRESTERVRVEAEMSRQKEVLQTIFDHIPVMINLLGPGGRILLVNREWVRVLGWSLEEAPAHDIVAELYPDPEARRKVLSQIETPPPGWIEAQVRVRNGRTIDTAWALVALSDGTSIGFGLDVTERKRAEGALRANERQFRAVFEGSMDAMVLADDDGRYVDVNPAACELFGLPREELIGRTVAEFTMPGFDTERAWADFQRGGSKQGLFRLRRPDGTVRETEYSARANILPGRHLSIMRDVTERRRAEEALRESERRVVTVLESITDGFYTLDRDWRFSYLNPQAEPILRRRRGELMGRNVWEEFPEAVGTAFDHHYHRAIAEQVPVSFEVMYPPLGGWFSIHAYPSADGLSVYFTDITERHEAEEALARSERRFRLVLENSRDFIYQLNLSTCDFDYVSPSVHEVLGYPVEHFATRGLTKLAALTDQEDFERLRGPVDQLVAGRPGAELDQEVEYRMRVPGKGWRWVNDRRAVVRGVGGSPVGIVGNIRDVTDQRLNAERLRDLSRRLIQAQEEERRHIARELHDEIGQALTAVMLSVRAALRDMSSPAAARRLEECLGLVERTIGQVRDLSLILRPSMLDDLGLPEALRSHVAGFARLTGVEARFAVEGENARLDPELETACYRIAQEALTNVARHARAARVRVELTRSESVLRLTVADDGVGFDAAEAAARAAGSSLGLLGMRERASLVGGRVEITSAPGRGTEVRADFPRATDRPASGAGPRGG